MQKFHYNMPNKVINSKDDIALCFPAQSRINRLNNQSFNNIPKDFFYGYFYLKSKNYKVEILDTRIKEKNLKILLEFYLKI